MVCYNIFWSGQLEIGNIRTHRMRVETIFESLTCRRSLTPLVSPSRAPFLSFTHCFQAPATQDRFPWAKVYFNGISLIRNEN